jgi:GTP cyclohydrolase I
MVTSAMLGIFRTNSKTRGEFLEHIRRTSLEHGL